MARLVTAGFETGSLQELNGGYSYVGVELSTAQVRTGSYALHLYMSSMAPSYILHTFGANVAEVFFRFALFIDSATVADGNLLVLRDEDAAIQASLVYDAATQTLKWQDGAGTTLASGTVTLRKSIWYVIEGHVLIAASGGQLTVKVNAVTDATFTGDTLYTAKVHVRSFKLQSPSAGGGNAGFYFDDIAFNDTSGSFQNSWIGLGGVFFLKANADGATTQFTPSAGSDHYALVDDVPANNTDYVQDGTTDHLELFEVEDCPDYVTSVDVVQVAFQAAIVESGSQELKPVIRQDTTNYVESPQTVVSIEPGYVLCLGIPYYEQPDGVGGLSDAIVDGLQVGVKIG